MRDNDGRRVWVTRRLANGPKTKERFLDSVYFRKCCLAEIGCVKVYSYVAGSYARRRADEPRSTCTPSVSYRSDLSTSTTTRWSSPP